METRKKIIIVIIIITVLVLIAGLLFVLLYKPKEVPTNGEVNGNTNQGINNVNYPLSNVNQQPNVNQLPPEEREKAGLTTIAVSFAERYGTFSSQSNYENLINLKSLMTKYLQAVTDKSIADSKAKNPDTSVYHGFTTKGLSPKILDFQMYKSATFNIITQRIETIETPPETKTFYQDITIKFIWEDNDWKVNEATWGETIQ